VRFADEPVSYPVQSDEQMDSLPTDCIFMHPNGNVFYFPVLLRDRTIKLGSEMRRSSCGIRTKSIVDYDLYDLFCYFPSFNAHFTLLSTSIRAGV